MNKLNETDEQGYFLVPKTWLNNMNETLQQILKLLEGENKNNPTSIGDYIPEPEARRLLGRKTTWFWQMRKNGKLPFAKVGSKIFYQKNDIVKLLEKNFKNPLEDFTYLRKAA